MLFFPSTTSAKTTVTSEVDSLLMVLDKVIKDSPIYSAKKLKEIQLLRSHLNHSKLLTDQYRYASDLYSAFSSYNADSAFYYAKKRMSIAKKINHPDYLIGANMNIAELMVKTGMYKEALDIMKTIHVTMLDKYLKGYYYHIYRTLYGSMCDYSVTADKQRAYAKLADVYRDSIMLSNAVNSSTYVVVKADQDNTHGDYEAAIKSLQKYYTEHQSEDPHTTAFITYTLSEAYKLKGDVYNEKKFLIISSISDLRASVKEYISLRKLAALLYKEGNIDKAYAYLKLSMKDAVVCNARQRMVEILELFPVINESYQVKKEEQQQLLVKTLYLISVLVIFLLLAIVLISVQIKKRAAAQRLVEQANLQLQALNKRLIETNHDLSESNYVKENYIAKYMNQCTVYIKKIDKYRSSLKKLLLAKDYKSLHSVLKSTELIDEELAQFYHEFDETFLKIYPHFVEELNALLLDKEKVYPKKGELLNTELRIYALIRLGITDSTKIAEFLRYSTTTIYNYRTKIRNKAAGKRSEFDQQVMNIGKKTEKER